jgi:hypothetical protein
MSSDALRPLRVPFSKSITLSIMNSYLVSSTTDQLAQNQRDWGKGGCLRDVIQEGRQRFHGMGANEVKLVNQLLQSPVLEARRSDPLLQPTKYEYVGILLTGNFPQSETHLVRHKLIVICLLQVHFHVWGRTST